jgi:hypothetical protein
MELLASCLNVALKEEEKSSNPKNGTGQKAYILQLMMIDDKNNKNLCLD